MKTKKPKAEFEVSAVKEAKCYVHFHITAQSALLYGSTVDEIIKVKLRIAKDQTVPKEQLKDLPDVDYWGWFDFASDSITLIFQHYFMLNMCFANGIKAAEDAGKGKAYRLEVIEVMASGTMVYEVPIKKTKLSILQKIKRLCEMFVLRACLVGVGLPCVGILIVFLFVFSWLTLKKHPYKERAWFRTWLPNDVCYDIWVGWKHAWKTAGE